MKPVLSRCVLELREALLVAVMLLQAENRLVAAGRTQDSNHSSMGRKVGGEDLVHVGAFGMHPLEQAHDQSET